MLTSVHKIYIIPLRNLVITFIEVDENGQARILYSPKYFPAKCSLHLLRKIKPSKIGARADFMIDNNSFSAAHHEMC